MNETYVESYTLEDFTTEDWWFRAPHDGSNGIDFASLVKIHRATGELAYDRLDRAAQFWFAVHLKDHSFTIYIYEVDGWSDWPATQRSMPSEAWPMFLVIGTTFDGCRETQGCPCATGSLARISAAALAVDRYIVAQGWTL